MVVFGKKIQIFLDNNLIKNKKMIQELNVGDEKVGVQKNPYSVRFLNPDEILAKLEMLPGMSVAHFGCGAGFFTFPIAKKIGDDGMLYALDILKEKVETVRSQAKMNGMGNIIARRASLENENGSQIDSESLDWVILVNMLYQNEKKDNIIEEAKRVLKKGGHILLIDWKNLDGSIGPEMKSRVSQDELRRIIQEKDLGILKEFEASNFHFGWVLEK